MEQFLKKELDLSFFHQQGYHRKKCNACGAFFWTLDEKATRCGDQPCVPFQFIGNPMTKKKLSLTDVRNEFLTYFQNHNHDTLSYPKTGNRCPVVARWRTDIYLTIASIADFQPHVTSGIVPPPANPLVISQPCIRLNDLDEVGVSGRHLTTFEMMGHHAFNKKTDEIYWKEQTVAYCDEYFTGLGIPKESINYKEQMWYGGGNAGPCLEVLAGGLEIATLVFMNMKQDDQGEYTINGEQYTKNPLNIVDTGYGLERIAWISQGTKTVYETVFPEMLTWIKNHSKQIKDTKALYSLADHTKTLSFMLGDGIVPSNVKSGYLARLLIRRALRFIETLHLDATLTDAVLFHLSQLTTDFPSLKEHIPQIKEMLTLETKRYKETLAKGEQLVKRLINEKQTIDEKQLITLYDTHGMPPAIVQSIAEKENVSVTIPENFESKIADLHTREEKTTEQKNPPKGLPKTIPLYYSDHYLKSFDATVLWTYENTEGTEVILNQTAFYPEGGGQPHDTGMIITKNKKKYPVTNVYKENGSIIHQVNGPIEVGEQIKGKINWDRRYIIMKHHTGTHVINGALRDILGDHIWQAGSQLHVSDARFDYAHYKPLTISERKQVEKLANEFIKKKITVNKKILDRNTAEKEYGFRLYQGGVPPGNSIRVLDIPQVDVEACGGTHLNNTGEIDKIRILRTERIQDGVNRVVFAASQMVDTYQEEEQNLYTNLIELLSSQFTIKKQTDIANQLDQSAEMFSVPSDQLPKTIQRFLKESKLKKKHSVNTLSEACQILFNNWKKTKKQEKTVSEDELQTLKNNAQKIPGTNYQVIIGKTSSDANVLAGLIIATPGFIIHLFDGKKVTSAASDDVDIDLRKQIVPAIGKILGGGGGGRPHMVQSGGPNTDNIDDALEKAKELTIKTLKN